MSRNTKIVLGVIGASLVICLCAAVIGGFALMQLGQVASESFKTDPIEARKVLDEMVTIELPEAYDTRTAMSMIGVKFVMVATPNDNLMMVMQVPNADQSSPEELSRTFSSGIPGSNDIKWEKIEDHIVTVRGEDVSFVEYKGTNSAGQIFTSWIGAFEGTNAPVILMAMALKENWVQADFDDFVAAIK